MEFVNTAIALLALVSSGFAISIARKQYHYDANIKYRKELIDVLQSLKRYRHIHLEMTREREKTGSEIEIHEEEMFAHFDSVYAMFEKLEDTIKLLLAKDRFKLNQEFLSNALVLKAETDSLSNWAEMKFDRFKRYNESKILELHEKLKVVQREFEKYEP
jgi:hypothetical protein